MDEANYIKAIGNSAHRLDCLLFAAKPAVDNMQLMSHILAATYFLVDIRQAKFASTSGMLNLLQHFLQKNFRRWMRLVWV